MVVHKDAQSGKLRFSVGRVAEVEERQNYRSFHREARPAAGSGGMGSLGALLAEKLGGKLGVPTPQASSGARVATKRK